MGVGTDFSVGFTTDFSVGFTTDFSVGFTTDFSVGFKCVGEKSIYGYSSLWSHGQTFQCPNVTNIQ